MAERIDEILGDWQEAKEKGELRDPDEVISAHPELAERLRVRFAALPFVDLALAASARLPEGTPPEIGDFRIVREIDRGGMGVVYEAQQVSMGRRVALKILSSAITATPHAVKRFQREARAAGRLHHTNIVPVYAMGQHAGYWYYAMELVDGRPLSAVLAGLKAHRPREETLARAAREEPAAPSDRHLGTGTGDRAYYVRVAEMFAGVAEALDLAHHEGIIHRDIKPSNLLLDADGMLKVVDFGLAWAEQDGPSMTITGDLLGTPAYMSPEQAMAKRVKLDYRTDVYSLGATLYEVATLRPPFEGTTLHDICSQIISKDPVLPRNANRHVPRDLETVVLKAMDKDRDKRYQSAGEFARDLRRFAEGAAIRARRIGLAGRTWRRVKRHKVRSSLTAAVVVLGVLGALLWRYAEREAALGQERRYEDLVAQAEAILGGRVATIRSVDPGANDATRDLLEDAIRLRPARPEAYWLRAMDIGLPKALRLRDLETARSCGFPRGAYHFARALLLRNMDLAASGEELALAAAHRMGTPVEFYFEGRLKALSGEREEAVAHFGSVIDLTEPEALVHRMALRQRARWRFRSGDYAMALEDLLKLDQVPDTQVWIASAWRRQGEGALADVRFAEAMRDAQEPAEWFALCDACRQLGEATWLERATAAAVEAFPDDAVLLSQRAGALTHQRPGRPAEALDFCRRALAEDPASHVAHKAHGFALLALGQRRAAQSAFEKAIKADPICPAGHLGKAAALRELGSHDRALEVLDRELDLRPCDAGLLLCRGNVRLDMGNLDGALEDFDQMVKHYPERADAHSNRAHALARKGRFRPAIEAAEKAIALDPECGQAHFIKGTVLPALGDIENAVSSLREAIRLLPRHVPSRLNLAEILLRPEAEGSALDLLNEALEFHRADPASSPPETETLIFLWRGGALFNLQEYDEAAASLDRARELYEAAPDVCPPGVGTLIYEFRGNTHINQGELAEGVAAWNRSFDLGNRNPETLNHLAWILATSATPDVRDPARAVEVARRAVRLAEQRGEFWNTLGVALFRSSEWSEALEALEESIKLQGVRDAWNLFFIAMAKHKLGHSDARDPYDEAVKWMENNKSDEAELWRFRAEAEEVLGITDGE